ncbi:MAG: Holliday junction branch migration protein RuvA [Clostridiales bacterium]|nr:Holliday junction branch migration protein RuvA [Clostridiales bacterium]
MISYIKGKVDLKESNLVVVENNGIGYTIYTSTVTINDINVGDEVKLYTYMNVKEDAIALYGFLKKEELNLFKMLLSVSGVGPKVARAVLSTLTLAKFSVAVITKDEKALTRAPGVGKKAAQRIILELQDKIKSEEISFRNDTEVQYVATNEDGAVREAISALIVLGYDYNQAQTLIGSIYKAGMGVEDIIKMALKASIA